MRPTSRPPTPSAPACRGPPRRPAARARPTSSAGDERAMRAARIDRGGCRGREPSACRAPRRGSGRGRRSPSRAPARCSAGTRPATTSSALAIADHLADALQVRDLERAGRPAAAPSRGSRAPIRPAAASPAAGSPAAAARGRASCRRRTAPTAPRRGRATRSPPRSSRRGAALSVSQASSASSARVEVAGHDERVGAEAVVGDDFAGDRREEAVERRRRRADTARRPRRSRSRRPVLGRGMRALAGGVDEPAAPVERHRSWLGGQRQRPPPRACRADGRGRRRAGAARRRRWRRGCRTAGPRGGVRDEDERRRPLRHRPRPRRSPAAGGAARGA